MPITYPTVELDGKEYPALATLADATDYLAAEPEATAWRDGSDDDRARWLIGASRAILRQPLAPEVFTGPDVPPALAEAAELLAAALADGFTLSTPAPAQVKLQKAGSVEQEFFYNSNATASLFPLAVMALLRPLFAGGGGDVAGVVAFGTCAGSSFEDPFGTFYQGQFSDDDNRFRRAFD